LCFLEIFKKLPDNIDNPETKPIEIPVRTYTMAIEMPSNNLLRRCAMEITEDLSYINARTTQVNVVMSNPVIKALRGLILYI
jgi:hypothetical protein